MMLPRDLSVMQAWRGAFVAATLNVVAMPGGVLLARDIPNMPSYPSVVSALIGVGLLGVLMIRRQRATVRLASVVFLVNTAAILGALWITSGYWAATGTSWTPFEAHKLGALALALPAPTLAVGLVSIAGFAATAIGKFYVLGPEIQRRFPVGEPWVILLYALFGGVLLGFRLRGVTMERETLRLQAETAAAEQLARTFLHLRDYANTPIQTIAFTVELVRMRHPELNPDVARLQRAVERLRKLSRALTRYESAHQWRAADTSLDGAALTDWLPGGEARHPQHREHEPATVRDSSARPDSGRGLK